MARPAVPPQIEAILKKVNPAVLASVRPNGTPHTCACWYLWDKDRVMLTFDKTRKRLEFIRRNPAVSLCVLDHEDWFRNVALFGRVVELDDDKDLGGADRMAYRYIGKPYPDREKPRVIGWMAVDSWFAWDAKAEVTNLEDSGVLGQSYPTR